jgi:outer membrane receptor protein involved in Fe transport
MEDLGNPDLKPFRTLQTSLGFEQTLSEHANIDLEGFYKDFQDLPVGTEGGAPPRFVNEGEGRAYGMEFLFELRMSAKTQAFASYTLSRSERKDGDGPWRLFDYDQTHNLSLTANYDLGKGWLAGARFRLVSGNPFSRAEGAVYDASSDTYRPLFSSINSDRNPMFHQLDVRVEKLWEIGPVDLTVYLEIMNVYNAKNRDGYAYSFDYTESQGAIGMPFFPNLGIRGEL